MRKKHKTSLNMMLTWCISLLLSGCNVPVLDPKGVIASDERTLILTAVGLMLIVVIPVFILTFTFAWKFRASNTKAKYDPTWNHSTILEVVWWAIPCIIIGILATITWVTTHRLDPYRPLDIKTKPITIEAVSLDWKWLFIYPEQNIASVNYVEFPVNVPVIFKITSDAPMNSLWIPQLSGQIYSMTGMQTKLHIMATEIGDYRGGSAAFSGAGFSDMHFIARASSENEFNNWVNQVRQVKNDLSTVVYNDLSKPSEKSPVIYYSSVKPNLYNDIINKFMMPSSTEMSGNLNKSSPAKNAATDNSGMSADSM